MVSLNKIHYLTSINIDCLTKKHISYNSFHKLYKGEAKFISCKN